MRRYLVAVLALMTLVVGIGMARADLVSHHESPSSFTEACLSWSKNSWAGEIYRETSAAVCGREETWWYEGVPGSTKFVYAERVVRECNTDSGCSDRYREGYEGGADEVEFSANPDTGVLLFNLDLEGPDGSRCTVRGTGTTTEEASSASSGPQWTAHGGGDWARISVFDGQTDRGAEVDADPPHPSATVFQNERSWSQRSGAGSGEVCGWAEAEGEAHASMFSYSNSEHSDSINPTPAGGPVTSTTLPQPLDPNQPPPVPGLSSAFIAGGLHRGGYALNTNSTNDVSLYWRQRADHYLYPGSDLEGLQPKSNLSGLINGTYFMVPLPPASVIYDPIADSYQIDAATEACEVHLTLARPIQSFDGTSATAWGGGRSAGAGRHSSGSPWVFTGEAGSWTGESVYTFRSERRVYSGTVCGTAVQLPGDFTQGLYSSLGMVPPLP